MPLSAKGDILDLELNGMGSSGHLRHGILPYLKEKEKSDCTVASEGRGCWEPGERPRRIP
jgi:hypothetical protein